MTKPTTADMDAVLDFAKARGLGGRFHDARKRYLVLTLPEDAEEKSQQETQAGAAAGTHQSGDGSDG